MNGEEKHLGHPVSMEIGEKTGNFQLLEMEGSNWEDQDIDEKSIQ